MLQKSGSSPETPFGEPFSKGIPHWLSTGQKGSRVQMNVLTKLMKKNMKRNYKYSLNNEHATCAIRSFSAVLSVVTLLFALAGPVAALDAYVATDKNDAKKEPPVGGGNGWLGGANVGLGVTVNANQTIWVACRNGYNPRGSKSWDITLTSTGLPAEVDSSNLTMVEGSGVGFDNLGKPINATGVGGDSNAIIGVQRIHMSFSPCPEWEQLQLKNNGAVPITFRIDVVAECTGWTMSSSTIRANTTFGQESGIIPTNQLINQIYLFPKTVAVDQAVAPTFSAVSESGNWTPGFVFQDPYGNDHPLGGVLFSSDGDGLNPNQSCAYSFTMQGPAADLQYVMFAFDSVSQQFQEYDIDLRPTVTITAGNNAAALKFDSVLGLNYMLETSTDLHNWQPRQTFTGTGAAINGSSSMNGPLGFFRLRCVPSAPSNQPPSLSALNSVAFSNTIIITFSEPVSTVTAANPANYMVGGNLGPMPIQSVSPVWPRAVKLTLGTTLMPGNNYFLGVQGVRDLSGTVMTPTTLPFTATTLQNPCPGGTLLVQQAYSECNPDGFWHVVQDDWYQCPDGTKQKFRVADTKTTVLCGAGQAASAPSPVGLLYPTEADVASTCQSPVLIGQIQVRECLGGLWSISTYLKYKCLNGTVYLSGPVTNVPMNPATPCNQPPPPMPAP
jgi:hypothetical protein